MTHRSPTLLLSAGEPSGDAAGAAVARALKARWPAASLYGLGGPAMEAAGVELLADFHDLAVMGLAEVAGRLPYFMRLLRRLTAEMRARGTDLVLPIDYPGFNLRLARRARSAAIPVLYYIAPQVWAWHRSRMAQLARNVDRLAVILPFEEPLFREAGAAVRFVGHPLLDAALPEVSAADFRATLGIDAERPLLALFPGSRGHEVRYHLPLFLEAAARVRAEMPSVQPVLARSSGVPASRYEGVPYPITADARGLLRHARAALVKSGTTTLEAALAGTPMVITYRMHPVSYFLARRLVRVPHIGLVNLVAGRRVAPELVQGQATPETLATALLPLLAADSAARAAAVAGLGAVREALRPAAGGGSAAGRVVELAEELLGAGG